MPVPGRTLRAAWAWARRVGRRGATTTLFTMLSSWAFAPFWCGRFKRPTARFWCWPIRWPTLALFLALLAHFGALLGLCCWRAMLGKLGAGLQCLFSLDECTVLGAHTVCIAYGLAYVLAYGIALAMLALGVWFSAHWACCNGYRSKPQGAAR